MLEHSGSWIVMVWRIYWTWLGWAGYLFGIGDLAGHGWRFGWIGDLAGMGWDGLGWAEPEIWLGLENGLGWGFSWIGGLIQFSWTFWGLKIWLNS